MPDTHQALGIRYAVRTDVGRHRDSNEDAAYAGPRLLAVADGLGGHAGGEVASAAAIEALRPLDTEIPAPDLMAALEHAVREANDKLQHIAAADPSLRGLDTTLTAMLWSGSQLALVHIGDSRAYLLRNAELFQITHDHTLVQTLIDEGRITPDEAASHPQRSLLMQALDGGASRPDLQLREAQLGRPVRGGARGQAPRRARRGGRPRGRGRGPGRPGQLGRRPGQHHLRRRRRRRAVTGIAQGRPASAPALRTQSIPAGRRW